MRRIYFAVFGSGLGHAARILEISDRLARDGDELLYSSFDEGLDFLRTHGIRTLHSPSVEVKWNPDGSVSTKNTFIRFPKGFMDFSKQVAFESRQISQFRPNLVVSDSRLSAVFAARSNSYPVVTILNQFKVLFPSRFRGKRFSNFYERIAGDILGLFWSLSNRVLMTDLPPPYTIGEANILGTDVSSKVEYVGFTSPSISVSEESIEKAKKVLDIDSRQLIFIQISGPKATKNSFIDFALRSAGFLSKKFNVVISLGYPGGSVEPRRYNGAWVYEWCPLKDELFLLSSVLVARSGHGTIGQCINTAKPAVLIPIHNHSEQLANAEKFQRLGLGIAISSGELDSKRLEDSVESCLYDPKYRKNAEKLMAISKKYDGVETVVRIIKSYK